MVKIGKSYYKRVKKRGNKCPEGSTEKRRGKTKRAGCYKKVSKKKARRRKKK